MYLIYIYFKCASAPDSEACFSLQSIIRKITLLGIKNTYTPYIKIVKIIKYYNSCTFKVTVTLERETKRASIQF